MEIRRLLYFLLFLTLVSGQLCDSAVCSCQAGQCSTCVSSYFYASQGNCYTCDLKCRSCSGPNNCTGTCAKSYYLNAQNSMCDPCPSKCQSCVNSTVCTLCRQGYAMSNGTCTQCLISNALICDTPTTVSTCLDGFWKNGDTCMPCRQYCLQCTGPTSCSQCAPGYLKQYAAGTFCAPCISGCMTCTTTTTCDACFLNFNLVNGSCVNITDTCIKTIPNCLSCSSSNGLACVVCKPLYYLSNGVCIYGASMLCRGGAVGPQPYKCSFQCVANTYLEKTTNSNTTFSCLPEYEISSASIYQVYRYSSYSYGSYVPSTSATFCNENNIYSLTNSIQTTIVMQPYFQLNIMMKVYAAFLQESSAPSNLTMNLILSVRDNSTVVNWDNQTLSNVRPQFPCSPIYLNFSTRNVKDQRVTFGLTAVPSSNFPSRYGYIGVTQLLVSVHRCAEDCRICANSNFCLVCKSLFVSNNQCVENCGGLFEYYVGDPNNYTSKACLSSCPDGLFPNTSGSTYRCSKCVAPCVLCRSEQQCLSCQAGKVYYAQNFSCLDSCPATYYNSSSVCLQCNTPCRTCTNETNCLSCSIGYFNGSACVASCRPGFFQFQLNSSCVACNSNCLTCSMMATNCLTCPDKTYLLGSTCVSSCPVNGYFTDGVTCRSCRSPCLNCLSSTACTSCLAGFLFNQSCVITCPNGKYPQTADSTCQNCDVKCLTCYSLTSCQSCSTGFYLFQSSCLSSCPTFYYPSVNMCLPCTLPCLTCLNSTACMTCQTGFLSQKVNFTCLNSCQDGYYGSNAVCTQCPATCQTCSSNTTCLSCPSGLVLNNNQCLTTCNQGQYARDGRCYPCSFPCSTCAVNSSSCLSCVKPLLLRNSQCVSQCLSGQYSNNVTCVACTGDCQTCSNATTCLSCLRVSSGTQKYYYNQSCLSVCPAGTFADTLTLQCKVCVFPCSTCLDSFNCLGCQIGFLNNQTNRCDFCPANQYADVVTKTCILCNSSIQNCQSCSNSTWCTQCQPSFFLYQGRCITNSACLLLPGFYIDSQQSVCTECVAPCLTCTSQISCSSCLTGFLFQSACLNGCPQGYYAESATKECKVCNSSICKACINTPDTCLQCYNTSSLTVLFNRSCISPAGCPKEYYVEYDKQFPQCLPCTSPCRQCISSTKCTSCWSGILKNNSCVANCPVGSFSQVTGGLLICSLCNSSCLTCINSSSNCVSCSAGKVLQAGKCLGNCTPEFYPDANSLSCLPCRPPCATCNSILTCVTCLNGLLLYYGQCVQLCPEGSYPNLTACVLCPQRCQKCKVENSQVVCTTCSGGKLMISTQPGDCIESCPDGWYPDIPTLQCYQCQTPCQNCKSATKCSTCIPNFLSYKQQCIYGQVCPIGSYRNVSACQESCDSPLFGSPLSRKCEQSCPQNYLKSGRLCVLSCPIDSYIDSDFVCNSCYDPSGLFKAECSSLLKFTIEVRSIFNNLFLRATFTQQFGRLLQSDLAVVRYRLIDKRRLSEQQPLRFSILDQTTQTLTLQLSPTSSISQEVIELRIGRYLVTSKGVLQHLSGTYVLEQFDLYQPDTIRNAQGFQRFSQAICIISTMALLLALVFNIGAALYPIFDCLQLLFLLLFCNIDFAPLLNHFLFGMRYMHFLYLPQIFAQGNSNSHLLKLSPEKFGAALTDISFLGNVGPAFIIIFCFAVILIVGKLLHYILGRSKVRDELDNQHTKVTCLQKLLNRFKWCYFNDVLFLTFYYLCVFSMTQMINFSIKSGYNYLNNFFSVVFILLSLVLPICIWLIIRSNYVDRPEEANESIKAFLFRMNPEYPLTLYSIIIKYVRKIVISLLIVVVSAFPSKTSYPNYLLGMLCVYSLLQLILTAIYKPYFLKAEVVYHCLFEGVFLLILLVITANTLGYSLLSIDQKTVAAVLVIIFTFVLFGMAMAYFMLLFVNQIWLFMGKKSILECFGRVDHVSQSDSDVSKAMEAVVPVQETQDKLVVPVRKEPQPPAESSEADSDFHPYLKDNGSAPQILIKCIKNLEANSDKDWVADNVPAEVEVVEQQPPVNLIFQEPGRVQEIQDFEGLDDPNNDT